MSLLRRPECVHAIVNSAAGGTLAITGGGAIAGQRVGIYRIAITVGAAVNVTVQDTGAGALSAPIAFLGAAPLPFILETPINGEPLWQSNTGLGIQLNASGAVQVNADIWFIPTL
jgi:hypothetical protein